MTGMLIKRESFGTENILRKDEGRDQSDVLINQGTPKWPGKHQKLGQRQGTDFSLHPQYGPTLQHPGLRLPASRIVRQ